MEVFAEKVSSRAPLEKRHQLRACLETLQEGKPLGTPKKNSFASQSIGGPVWEWIIAVIKKIFTNSP